MKLILEWASLILTPIGFVISIYVAYMSSRIKKEVNHAFLKKDLYQAFPKISNNLGDHISKILQDQMTPIDYKNLHIFLLKNLKYEDLNPKIKIQLSKCLDIVCKETKTIDDENYLARTLADLNQNLSRENNQ